MAIKFKIAVEVRIFSGKITSFDAIVATIA